MLTYTVPGVIFVIVAIILYYRLPAEERTNINLLKTSILPALVAGGLVYAFMRFRESSDEPVMTGNYFDN
jgi:hypothetical protein